MAINYIKTISDFSNYIDKDSDSWQLYETRDKITKQINDISRELLKKIDINILIDLISTFNKSLNCEFSIEGNFPLKIDDTFSIEEFNKFLDENKDINSYRLDFIIDKKKLLENIIGVSALNSEIYLYLFPETLKNVFKSNLKDIENAFWKTNIENKKIVLLPDIDIKITGDYLNIIGGKFLNKIGNIDAHIPSYNLEVLQKIYIEAKESLNWQSIWIEKITPYHLLVKSTEKDDYKIKETILSRYVNLFFLYTADKTREKNDQYQSTYYNSKYSQKIDWFKNSEIDEKCFTDFESFINLNKIFKWIYQNNFQPSERLPLIQILISKTFRNNDSSLVKHQVLEKARFLYLDLESEWKNILENKIAEFSEEKEKIQNEIIILSNNYSTQINEFTSELSKTALAFVGVLLGSFIAALFKNDFNIAFFKIGIKIYFFYIIIFPLFYNMSQQWSRFSNQQENFDNTIIFLKSKISLNKDFEDNTKKSINKTKLTFKIWFIITLVIYIIILIVLYYLIKIQITS